MLTLAYSSLLRVCRRLVSYCLILADGSQIQRRPRLAHPRHLQMLRLSLSALEHHRRPPQPCSRRRDGPSAAVPTRTGALPSRDRHPPSGRLLASRVRTETRYADLALLQRLTRTRGRVEYGAADDQTFEARGIPDRGARRAYFCSSRPATPFPRCDQKAPDRSERVRPPSSDKQD